MGVEGSAVIQHNERKNMDTRGWYEKYDVSRDGVKLFNGKGGVFVLNHATDPHAVVALRAYADSVREVAPDLATDIDEVLSGVV
jgi:hypothetical protein